MSLRLALLALPLSALLAAPAAALTFNFSQVNGDTLTPAEGAAFATAASAWSAILGDNVTVNVHIGFRDLGRTAGNNTILGSTFSSMFGLDYGTFSAAFAADRTSAADAAADAALPAQVPGGTVEVTTAQAKALGASPANGAGLDGTIEFTSNSGIQFADTRADLNGGNYDLIGIAEHEIAHLLGFDSSVDSYNPVTKSVMDLFRYNAAATPSFTAGQAAYFSLDSGVTSLASFAVGGSGQDQGSHWLQGTGGLMDPQVAAGHTESITALDITALDVLGYDVAVPEPASVALLGSMLLGLAGVRRRG